MAPRNEIMKIWKILRPRRRTKKHPIIKALTSQNKKWIRGAKKEDRQIFSLTRSLKMQEAKKKNVQRCPHAHAIEPGTDIYVKSIGSQEKDKDRSKPRLNPMYRKPDVPAVYITE